MMTSEADTPTVTPPTPRNERLRASAVPDEVSVVWLDAYRPSACADWLAAEMVMVPLAPLSDWLRVTLLPPARSIRTWAPDATPEVPEVFPRFDMPCVWLSADCAAVFGPDRVIVADAPFTDWLAVMLLPAAMNRAIADPDAMPVVPDVLPRFEMPALWLPPPPAAPKIVTVALAPLEDWLSVMLLDPTSCKRIAVPVTRPVDPPVLPWEEMPTLWVPATAPGTTAHWRSPRRNTEVPVAPWPSWSAGIRPSPSRTATSAVCATSLRKSSTARSRRIHASCCSS